MAQTPVTHRTNVEFSMRQISGAVVALVGIGGVVLWAVITFTVGGMRDDIKEIRLDVSSLTKSVENASKQLSETQLSFTKEIGAIRVDFEGFRGDFKAIRVSLEDIKNKVDSAQKSLPKQ